MTDRRAVAVLVLLHLAMVAIVQPRGDFPLNDDWAFAQSVRWLLDEGHLRLSEWVAMNLAPQAIVGAGAAAVFGFSFETLRHVTQAVALAALVAAYAWFRRARLEPTPALVAAAALAAFPAWPVLANSFMTDLYGLLLGLLAAMAFLEALETSSARALVLATLLSAIGVLERQVAIVLPLAFMVARLWTMRPLLARRLAAAVLPLVVVAAVEIAFSAYLSSHGGIPEGQRVAHARVLPMAVNAITNQDHALSWSLSNAAGIAGYLGLFSFAWLAWWGMPGATRWQTRTVLVAGLVIAAASWAFAWLPPYRENYIIDRVGIGPFLLYDAIRFAPTLDRSAGPFWTALSIPIAFAIAAMGVALAAVFRRVSTREADPALVFMIVVIAAYLAPFIVTDYFDRYLLFILPFVFALWARLWPHPKRRVMSSVALACVAAGLLLSAVATRDYFSWNRARWDAIRAAEKLGGNAQTIDGGFEHGGLTRYEGRASVPEGKSWYWVRDDQYVVAFSSVPGYDELASWKVAHWLPRSPSEVKLLRRKP